MTPDTVILHDAATGRWLHFQTPIKVVEVHSLNAVLPALRRVEAAVHEHGLYAAGFITYETAPAFDPALRTRPPTALPLLWFGLYQTVLRNDLAPSAANDYSLGEWRPSVTWETYRQAIATIKEYIARGYTYQVNYTHRLRAPFAGDALALFADLWRAQPAAYAAYVDTGRFALCSASLELFFRLDGRRIVSRPMKGTAPRGRTLAEDHAQREWLRHSPKNQAENVMIVDMVRNDLGRVAQIGTVGVPELFTVERYPTVWQMTSTVTGETETSFVDIMTALFPCASITGAPKVRTMGLIAELEDEPRAIYTGAIGYLAPGRLAQFNVAIRTALVDRQQGQATYGVGGGIVWDSSAEEEYRECQVKARVLSARPPFDLLETMLWTPAAGYLLLDDHLRRLSEAAEYFGYPLELAQVRDQLQSLATALARRPQRVRLLLAEDGEVTLEAAALVESSPEPVRLGLARMPVDSSNVFLYHKTTNRQVYETARAGRPACDDVLLWNERGEITETTIGNVVVQMGGQWWTPPVASGLLPGTMRARLLAEGRIRERVISRVEAVAAEAIYVVNSLRGWRPAVLVDRDLETAFLSEKPIEED